MTLSGFSPASSLGGDAQRTLGLDKLAAPELDVLFRRAERIDRDSAWFAHVPFAHWLIRAVRPQLLVELGTHAGVSYAAFCNAVEAERLKTRCYAVDTWRGDDHAGHYSEEVFIDLTAYHDNRFAAFSQMLRCTFNEARDMFRDSSIDLLHIDGFHTYDAVKGDFERWLPKLSERGIVVFHDTNERTRDFGVWRLWAEICTKFPSFEFAHGHGLGILCVGPDVPDALRALCSLPLSAAETIRARFAHLGERWAIESRAIKLGEIIATRETCIVQLEQAVQVAEAARASATASAAAANAELTTRLAAAVKAAQSVETRRRAAEQRLAAIEAMAEARRVQIEVLQQQVQELSSQLGELSSQLGQLSIQVGQSAHERDLILNSTAWKMTWPARQCADILLRAFHGFSRRPQGLAGLAAKPWSLRSLRILRDNRRRPAPVVANYQAAQSGQSAPTLSCNDPYENWIREYEASTEPAPGIMPSLDVQSDEAGLCFSFLLATADKANAVVATVESLQSQGGADWELLATNGVMPAGVVESSWFVQLPEMADADRGVVLNSLLSKARGHWIAVLDAGDILAPGALRQLRLVLAQEPDAIVLYSDEDEILANGRRQTPQFKPSWSPEMLQAFNYFGRLTVLSRTLATEAGGFSADGAGAEWSLNLRAADAAVASGRKVVRIPRVLCHRAFGGDRERPMPGTPAAVQHRDALKAFWAQRGIHAVVETQPDGTQRSNWDLADPPLVSVIIPNCNGPETLRCCLEGVLNRTDYTHLEVIVVENCSEDPSVQPAYNYLGSGPNLRTIRVGRSVNNFAAFNRGAEAAKGNLLLFLNDDIDVIDSRWLGELVRIVTLPGVGVAGTKLCLPDGTLQNAGISIGIRLLGLMFHHAGDVDWGVFGSSNHTRNWSAVGGGCQIVRREVFNYVGGFDETYHAANGDVVLCLRAQRGSWRIAYTPFAALVRNTRETHPDMDVVRDMARCAREVRRVGLVEDPYLHPQLSGVDSGLRLRAPGEESLSSVLQHDLAGVIAAAPKPMAPLDLFDNSDIGIGCGPSGATILWPPSSIELIQDPWGAARWILDLLRGRADLRRRFPRALSDGAAGAFAAWVSGEGSHALNLSDAARSNIAAAFAADPAARARQYYFCREDLRAAFPLALLPPGRRDFADWMLNHREISELRLEEIWWLLLQCAEDPAGELVRTYLFTPAWQEAHPDGLTPFGRDRFAAWLCNYYDLPEDAEWLRPQNWPVGLSSNEQIRLAYAARDDWRLAHPDAFRTELEVRAFITWLATDAPGVQPENRAWCAELLRDDMIAKLAAPGANIIGHFCYPSGLRVSVETIAEAIELAGGSVTRRDMRTVPGDVPCHASFGGLEPYDITIIHVQPEPFFDSAFLRSDLIERMPRTYRIAYWYWELEAAPDRWAEIALAVDEIWTATKFVADALRTISPVPIRTQFPGVRIGTFTPRSRHAFGLPGREEGRFAFLFSFHMSSVMERKNPLGLIRAFRRAFAPEEPVDLVLKTTSFGQFAAQVEELRTAAMDANISVVDQILTADETLSLMDACDAYVSLHRSEGLGLGMAEAMLLGKPVIATRYSGNLDFMDDGNSLLVDYDLIRLDHPEPPYDVAAYWAEPSTDHAAQLMRRLYDDQAWARALGATAQRDARVRLAPVAAGKRFLQRLTEIKEMSDYSPKSNTL
jgi:GT2 family glycosyltransferase/glycosyltransferase involved in cell wall biosynthesis